MTLLILAAGLGSRYGGNKQFDGVGIMQEYLLEYTMFDAIQAGIEHIVIVTRKEAIDEVAEYFEKRLPISVKLTCVAQSLDDVPEQFDVPESRIKPWGTAHAVWSARHVIEGKFATVNADDLYGRNGIEAAAKCMSSSSMADDYGLVGYQLDETLSAFGTVSRGVCKGQDGFLTSVVEYTKLRKEGDQVKDEATGSVFTGRELTSMNLWVTDSSIFPVIEAYFTNFFGETKNVQTGELYLPLIVQHLIDKGQVKVKLIDGKSEWHGMTYKEDKERLSEVLKSLTAKNFYPSPLWIQS